METLLYLLLGAFCLLFGMQYFVKIKSAMKKGKPAPELPKKYEKGLKSNASMLLYFYSKSCRACEPMVPIIERLKKSQPFVFKVNVQEEMSVAQKFSIMGTPSVVIIENGMIKEFLVGPQPESKIQDALKKV